MMKIKDKQFEVYLPQARIEERIGQLANELDNDYRDKDPLVIGVLNGSLYFLSGITLAMEKEVEIAMIRYQSYEGTQSSGTFKVSLPFEDNVRGRDILLVEDIVDTGRTLERLQQDLKSMEPASVQIVSLLLKPDVFKGRFPVKYVGFEIPGKFVLGYGLDYDGRGRNLRDIYVLSE